MHIKEVFRWDYNDERNEGVEAVRGAGLARFPWDTDRKRDCMGNGFVEPQVHV